MQIVYLPRFARQYKKLPTKIKILAERKEKLFRSNPFDPLLKTHKLIGPLNGFHSFSINNNYRIIFEFADKNIVRFYQVGTHEIYN